MGQRHRRSLARLGPTAGRGAVQSCYAAEPGEAADIIPERDALADLVAALIDQNMARACVVGPSFLERREARYAALADVEVPLHDGANGSCAEAEAIMELEEGVADYASWVPLFERGIASREQLFQRYRAQQSEWFYVTGAMQLHSVRLMQPDEILDITARVADSESWVIGSPTALLEASLGRVCAVP